jgi:hypothetical protein
MGLTLWPSVASAQPSAGPSPAGIYDGGHSCINNRTSLPSVAGGGFKVYSASSLSSVARSVAGIITRKHVLTVYEHGLDIPSLLQPGQPTPLPIFLDPALSAAIKGKADGVFAPLCQHPAQGSVAIEGNLRGDKLAATVYHELFHAAQYARLKALHLPDNWWLEATATAAEAWFNSSDHFSYTPALIYHPALPMDHFGNQHEYAAYQFVQWVMQSASMPDASGWAFLRASIDDLAAHASSPDAGLDQALHHLTPSTPCDPAITRLSCDVASFWGDETNTTGPSPRHSTILPRVLRDKISATEETHTFPGPKQYGSILVAFTPAAGKNQLEVNVPDLPAGVEMWLNLGKGELKVVRPGESFDETFCRGQHAEGTYPLPKTGDVRMALTSTTDHPPKEVTVKFTTGKSCQAKGIMMFQQSVNNGQSQAAIFPSATCRRITMKGGKTQFKATAKSGAYTLKVNINAFTGYHDYPLDFKATDPGFVVSGPGGPFSNVYWPGGTPPNHGGYITFAEAGTAMGLGFINAWNPSFSDAVVLAGGLTCNYSQSK